MTFGFTSPSKAAENIYHYIADDLVDQCPDKDWHSASWVCNVYKTVYVIFMIIGAGVCYFAANEEGKDQCEQCIAGVLGAAAGFCVALLIATIIGIISFILFLVVWILACVVWLLELIVMAVIGGVMYFFVLPWWGILVAIVGCIGCCALCGYYVLDD